MSRNVEVKLRLAALAPVRRRLAALGALGPTLLVQTDRYFAAPGGRLKLREERRGDRPTRFELIAYRRPDLRLRTSHFERVPIAARAPRPPPARSGSSTRPGGRSASGASSGWRGATASTSTG